VSKYFLNRLPPLVDASDKTGTVITYVVEDNIEGWADALEALLNCYFKNTPLTGRKIVFDFSKIRKKGAPLKTGGGKAPGYKGLKNTLTKITISSI
jgi:ribonucleoside-diphosphate reductase alpha chain